MEVLTCSLASLRAGEQLYGTAPQVKTWLLLELNEPMSAKALVDNYLPEQVRTYLNNQQKALAGSRLLLIQQGRRRKGSGVRFFICSSKGNAPLLLEYALEDSRDVLGLDIVRLASSAQENRQAARSQPIYLVCTNGKRDACCSALGEPFYRKLAALEPENTWQCSHVGGHRFAANVIYLPYGIYYGRLRAGQEGNFLNACREKHILAAHYRGRSTYPAHAQAAEYFLHQQEPGLRLDEMLFEHEKEIEPQHWQVQFRRQGSVEMRQIALHAELSDYQVFENCGKEHELNRKTQYHLIE